MSGSPFVCAGRNIAFICGQSKGDNEFGTKHHCHLFGLLWFVVLCHFALLPFLLSTRLTCPHSVMIKYLRSKGCL